MANARFLTLEFAESAPIVQVETMLFQSQGPAAPGSYFSPVGWNSGGLPAPQNVNRANLMYVAQAGTVKAMEIDSANTASDSTETFTVVLNGATTAVTATVVNGTKRGSITGQALAVAAGDNLAILYDPGASGAIGKVQVSLRYDLTP